jgi:hypothetical protein
MFIFVLWSAGNKKPATALAIAGFGKIFSYNCLCFHSHDAKLTGLMLPTGQTAVGRHHHLDLFGERCVHFVGDKKPYLRAFVNGIMEEPLARAFSLLCDWWLVLDLIHSHERT